MADNVPLSDEDEQALTELINSGASMRKVLEFWSESKRKAAQ